MNKKDPQPTPYQKRLVDIAFFVQFHLAALGHLALWCYVGWTLLNTPRLPLGQPDNGHFILVLVFYQAIPFSFAVLGCVYLVFRLFLAYTRFSTALAWMIGLDVLHSILLFQFVITPVRLLIPVILYSVALYSYCKQTENSLDLETEITEKDST